MLDSFAAIVLFSRPAALPDTDILREMISACEPGADVSVTSQPDALEVRGPGATATLTAHAGQIPEEEGIASIGMADLPEDEAAALLQHGGYVRIKTADEGSPVERMILLLKCGMALCTSGGWALCVPSSGLCLKAEDLKQTAALDRAGPRVWGLDDAEGELPAYEPRHLWESLRQDAQPTSLLIGFVPAQVENQTWFFSAGHSLFGLPEIVYSDGSLQDFATIRELFRYLFPYFYQRPHELKTGATVRTAGNELIISFHALPERFEHLQASTGTLRLRISAVTSVDNEWDS